MSKMTEEEKKKRQEKKKAEREARKKRRALREANKKKNCKEKTIREEKELIDPNQELINPKLVDLIRDLKQKVSIYLSQRDLLHFKDQFGESYDQTLEQILRVNLIYLKKQGLEDIANAESEMLLFQRVRLYFYRQLMIYPLDEVEKMISGCDREIVRLARPKSLINFTKGGRRF